MKFIFFITVNLFYLKTISKVIITKISLLCALLFSPLIFLLYIRELNYVYYIIIIIAVFHSFSIFYHKFKNFFNDSNKKIILLF